MSKKLTTNDKMDIVLSRSKSLRKLGSQYNVHHSTIDDIFKESEEVLLKYWDEKSNQVGRPKKQKEDSLENPEQKKELEETKKALAITQMKLDYANLRLKWANERSKLKETEEKHLKKKKRKN